MVHLETMLVTNYLETENHLVLLMPFNQSLCTGDVLCQFFRFDDGRHLHHPDGQLPVICQEPLELVRLVEFDLAVVGLQNQGLTLLNNAYLVIEILLRL